jgi:high-affinity Fe2+/Pb2+ permease
VDQPVLFQQIEPAVFPLWMGTWLGIYPTVETLGLQVLAFLFVIGSYFAAEWVSKRNLRKAIAASETEAAAPAPDLIVR